MWDDLARIEVGQPSFDLGQKDQFLDGVVERRVGREFVNRFADAITGSLRRHRGILTPFRLEVRAPSHELPTHPHCPFLARPIVTTVVHKHCAPGVDRTQAPRVFLKLGGDVRRPEADDGAFDRCDRPVIGLRRARSANPRQASAQSCCRSERSRRTPLPCPAPHIVAKRMVVAREMSGLHLERAHDGLVAGLLRVEFGGDRLDLAKACRKRADVGGGGLEHLRGALVVAAAVSLECGGACAFGASMAT